jgi:alkyl sulfatase BDS1-like metallo-beta-lactamase superfamily hydrolase
MPSFFELSDQLWSGKSRTDEPAHHPLAPLNRLEELGDGLAFYKAFVNVTVVRTDAGLLLIDTGPHLAPLRERIFEAVRRWSDARVDTAVYTHGHVDHAYGLPPFLDEAQQRGVPRPEIIGHEAVAARMDRYLETRGYNGIINSRQFGLPVKWPTDAIRPTTTYADSLALRVGDEELRLFHARGETDDHTWVYLPGRRVLCTGDLFIWAAPNAGNPQKVQRYCREWSLALRQMAALEPTLLLPGHGLPIEGEARVRAALLDTAEYLESLYRQTLDLLNQGATVYDIVHAVAPPEHLAEKPYLLPVYDEPEFIVRNVVRCLGGWYSGVPSELKPAPLDEQAREIATLAGGAERLAARAAECAERGNWRLACHLADWAGEAQPESAEVQRVRADIYERRTALESSTMSRGVYADAARTARERLEEITRDAT